MGARGTFIPLFLLTAATGSITATLPQCLKDEEVTEGACLIPAMDWKSAHQFCRSKGGFLIGPDEMARPEVTLLIPRKVAWTALGPHEGHLQWLTERPVMARNLQWAGEEEGEAAGQKCGFFHLPSQRLQPLPCSSSIPSICLLASSVEQTYTGVSTELEVMVDGGGAPVKENDGWVKVTDKVFRQLSLTCTAHLSPSGAPASAQPHVFWSKDGVYLPMHNRTLVPFDDAGPFSLELLQGTYWCEAWLPYSSARLASNKILLTLKDHEVLLLKLQHRQSPQSRRITTHTLEKRGAQHSH